ncbi:MAG: aspartate 1-decarboxylase [Verrucomicrobiota bacterium]|nr:aspartate 1-decarboxylase [Verrucomicrobiota bacterium]
MNVHLLRAKIHRATVTGASVDYEGSLAIDADFLRLTGLLPYEKILVGNISNGERFETYIIEAPSGSKSIVLNGAVAHLGKIGDIVVIMAFGEMSLDQARNHKPRVIVLGDGNTVIRSE